MADEVSIRIRARGGRQAAAEATGVEHAILGMGRAAGRANAQMTGLASRSLGRSLTSLRYQAYGAGLTIGGIGTFAVKAGLQFNSSMEQNEVAFGQFLGSSRAARQELATLYNLAKVTPFEFADLTLATRKFLAFGFTVKESNAILKTVADTASGLALDQGGIDRMVLAIGQIKSKGTLQSQDLRQLQELGAVDLNKLAKSLGLTREEMANVGKQHVPATKALRALKKQWDDTFGGMSAKQAKTFAGQISTLRDNTNQMLGTLTKPGFKVLETRVFPALNRTAGQITKTFQRKDIDLSQKFHISEATARRNLGPLVTAARAEFRQMHVGEWMATQFEHAVPRLADAAGNAAPRVATAFVRGWWHAGIYGKLFTAGLLLRKLGVFRLAGGLAAKAFLARYVPTVVAGEAAAGAGGGAVGGAGLLSRFGPWGAAGAAALGAGYFGTRAAAHALGVDDAIHRHQRRAQHDANVRAFHKQGRVSVRLPNGVIIWENRRDARRERGRQHDETPVARPRVRPTVVHHTTVVQVDRRTIGKAEDRYRADGGARR